MFFIKEMCVRSIQSDRLTIFLDLYYEREIFYQTLLNNSVFDKNTYFPMCFLAKHFTLKKEREKKHLPH